MDISKIRQRPELALKPRSRRTIEEALEQVSTRDVLRVLRAGPSPRGCCTSNTQRRYRRDVSAIGRGEEATIPLQRRDDAVAAGGVDAGEGEADGATQSRRRRHVQVGGQQAVRARRDVDESKEFCLAYFNSQYGHLGVFPQLAEASARKA